MIFSVRGAIKIDKNKKESIKENTIKLITGLAESNKINPRKIINIIFSVTRDITDCNPATALREIGFGNVPLFCTQEPEYKNSMSKVLRVMITFRSSLFKKIKPVYLNGAEALRKDIFSK